MRQTLRDAVTIAALTLLVGACTVEDVKDARAGDSIAAATSKSPASAQPAAAPGSAQAGNAASTNTPVAPVSSNTPAAPATSPSADTGTLAGGAAAPAAGAQGSLSPDSVDVGRRGKSSLVPRARLRLEVDLAARQLTAFDGDQRIASYPIAIGSTQWPTQTGQWEVKQVVWNPEWIPPKEEAWAEDRNPKQPGAPDNPLGRAQLVYDPPRTVHGTNDPKSIGKAVSHGSIRMANADIVQLARRVMEMAGAPKDESFYQHARDNRTQKVVVDLPQRVQIRVF